MRAAKVLVAALVLAAVSVVPVAAYDLVIRNNTDQDLASITVRPGQVANFRRMPSKSKKTFQVTLPSGQCETRITARMEDGQSVSTQANVCGGFQWTLGLDVY